jgi:dTDP-4-amino-4,6-dideoxygalactose transaminase
VIEPTPREPYLVFGRPEILDEDIDAVVNTLRSGWIGTGPRAAQFEQAFASYLGVSNAIAVGSCTAALQLALTCLGLERGDEVIVPSLTFAATANAVVHSGATPVLADVRRKTMCIGMEDIADRVTPRTRAAVVVHFGGRPCEIEEIASFCRERRIALVEDCAHAIETLIDDRHAGTFGDAAAFSFYVTKNVVTAEGGMLVTPYEASAARAKRLALHGLTADAWARFSDAGFRHYEVEEPGFKFNMTDIQAALGVTQLARVERNLERRAAIWEQYDEALADLPLWTPPPQDPGTRHARHLYTVLIDTENAPSRDAVLAELHRLGIGTGVHYRALHLHPWYRRTLGVTPEEYPNSTWISDRTLSIPLGPAVTDTDIGDVVTALRWATMGSRG